MSFRVLTFIEIGHWISESISPINFSPLDFLLG